MTTDNLTVDDVIGAGGCPSGIRSWFTARRDTLPTDMTLRRFIDSGMPLDLAKSLDDPFIERALDIRESERGR